MAVTVEIETAVQPDIGDMLHEGEIFMLGLYPPEACYLLTSEQLAVEGINVWVARDEDGVALGMAALVPHARDPLGGAQGEAVGGEVGVEAASGETYELKRMFVRDRMRGRGVGAELLRTLERWATAAGATRIVLETGPDNRAAIALYERHGFRPIPQFGEYVGGLFSTCFAKGLG